MTSLPHSNSLLVYLCFIIYWYWVTFFVTWCHSTPTPLPPVQYKNWLLSSIWRAELDPCLLELCLSVIRAETSTLLSHFKWDQEEKDDLKHRWINFSGHCTQRRGESSSDLVLLAGSVLAEASSKRPKPSSSAMRPQWGARIIRCLSQTIHWCVWLYTCMYFVVVCVYTYIRI